MWRLLLWRATSRLLLWRATWRMLWRPHASPISMPPRVTCAFAATCHQEREFDAAELFEFYNDPANRSALRPYLHIIQDSPVYPVNIPPPRRPYL